MAIARQAKAAEILGRHLQALQLRYLETLTVMATDKHSIIVFALLLGIVGLLLPWFDEKGGGRKGNGRAAAPRTWKGFNTGRLWAVAKRA